MIEREEVVVTTRQQLRDWLAEHHESSPGIWLVTSRRAGSTPRPSYEDIVQEALCFGWIDSTVRKLDDYRSALLLTPRRPTSTWSSSNKRRVASLLERGLLAPAGLAAIDLAKQNGSWSVLDSVERLELPDDLALALAANPAAAANFDGFSASSRKMILWWVISAKRPETRARRVAATVTKAAEGKRANDPRDT